MIDAGIAALIGAVVVVLGGVIIQIGTWWVLKPNLKILSELERTDEDTATYFRIIVKNEGKRVAKNCTGIMSIDNFPVGWVNNEGWTKINAATFKSLGKFEREILFWEEGERPYYVDINPGMKARLNIARLDYNDPSFRERPTRVVIPSEEGWESVDLESVQIDLESVQMEWETKSRISLNIPSGLPADEIPYLFRICVTSNNSSPTLERKLKIIGKRKNKHWVWSLEQA